MGSVYLPEITFSVIRQGNKFRSNGPKFKFLGPGTDLEQKCSVLFQIHQSWQLVFETVLFTKIEFELF